MRCSANWASAACRDTSRSRDEGGSAFAFQLLKNDLEISKVGKRPGERNRSQLDGFKPSSVEPAATGGYSRSCTVRFSTTARMSGSSARRGELYGGRHRDFECV